MRHVGVEAELLDLIPVGFEPYPSVMAMAGVWVGPVVVVSTGVY